VPSLGLDQKGLVLVLGNFWSLGLGLETILGLGLEEKVLFTSPSKSKFVSKPHGITYGE